jgi:Bacterial CdiA-CT RNAse A domain
LSSERDAQWARLEKTSFLTDDEKRAAIGYGPLPAQHKFNPGQLRKPTGSGRESGRWTKPGGDGGGDTGDNSSGNPNVGGGTDEILDAPATGGDNSPEPLPIADRGQYSVDLTEEEQGGGHTLRDHVGKSDAQLTGELERRTYNVPPLYFGPLQEGSFISRESANDFVNRSLERNSTQVDAVTSGLSKEETLNTRFGYPTGKEAYRAQVTDVPDVRDTYDVRVLIRRDDRAASGYRVITAFPRNELKR